MAFKHRKRRKTGETITNTLHVVHGTNGLWKVKKDGTTLEELDSQRLAVARAGNLAKGSSGDVIVHGKDGRIRDAQSYSSDPHPTVHVVRESGKWGVKAENKGRFTVVAQTKEEAIAVARKLVRNKGTQVVVHGMHGQILQNYNYSKSKDAIIQRAVRRLAKEQRRAYVK